MSLFHREREHHDEPAEFEVRGEDGVLRRYPREAFDMIVVTQDTAEVERQLALGWALLDERTVPGGYGPSSADDLILGIEGLHVGGSPGAGATEDVTSYTIGFLADGAEGEPVGQD
jgi:hypothetical protein